MALVRKRFRLSFLAKFTMLTAIVAIGVALSMSHFLIERHERAVEENEGINAVSQISAELTDPMVEIDRIPNPKPAAIEALLRPVTTMAMRLQYVSGLRVYRGNGAVLFPATAPHADAAVAHTLALGDLWSTGDSGSADDPTITQYIPFVAGRTTYVVAIDLSRDEMAAQSAAEKHAVLEAIGLASAVIFLSLVTLAAGASRELERRRREAEGTFSQTLGVLAQIIDRRDHYTAGHSRRVADYSRLLAVALKLSEREQDIVERAALLHDLGKIGIPDAILLKPGRLDDRERSVMNRHPVIGAEIIHGIASMEDIAPCVLFHHERIDGSGYPNGLRDSMIPLPARILAVADAFDAMTTDRPYRRALTIDAAVTELRRVAGTQLDAQIVDTFVTLVRAGKIVPPKPAALDDDIAPSFGPQALPA